jgi:cytoskeletal protein CcmA (bactofilin family)
MARWTTIDPKGNRLTIGPHGRVKANVIASAVVVQGKLEGSIQASDRVDLKQSAVVTGDIATRCISIDEGAYFKGVSTSGMRRRRRKWCVRPPPKCCRAFKGNVVFAYIWS